MNPPFENSQDIEHVTHAYRFLGNGGRLVAIMSASVFFRSDARARAFQDFIDNTGAHWEELPPGAFKSSGTMVKTYLIAIDR
jgi:16S rRNA G1207 methylase RsmC